MEAVGGAEAAVPMGVAVMRPGTGTRAEDAAPVRSIKRPTPASAAQAPVHQRTRSTILDNAAPVHVARAPVRQDTRRRALLSRTNAVEAHDTVVRAQEDAVQALDVVVQVLAEALVYIGVVSAHGIAALPIRPDTTRLQNTGTVAALSVAQAHAVVVRARGSTA